MSRTILRISLAAMAAWAVVLTASAAVAQGPIVTYSPASPAVAYVPEVRGLFGQRLVYRPVITAPAARVTTYYAPAPVVGYAAPVTTYYAPAAPVVSYPARITTYYAPAAPVVGYPARATTYYAPVRVVAPPVITAYPPWMVP